MIVVFHRTNTTSRRRWPPVKHFDPVAVIDIPDWQYDHTFELTNSIDDAWWKNDRVQPIFLGAHQRMGCRSTSVGDRVMLSDGRIMEVMPAGWEEVNLMTDVWRAIYWNKARWGFYITQRQPEDVQAS
tara:strand:- start:1733 stop:2116 length:384 start_codon:yes stop_codon:yes gene_type:complete